jgi:hypothetical protein
LHITKARQAAALKLLLDIEEIKKHITAHYNTASYIQNILRNDLGYKNNEIALILHKALAEKYSYLMSMLAGFDIKATQKLADETWFNGNKSVYEWLFRGSLTNEAGETCYLSVTEEELRKELTEHVVSAKRAEDTHKALTGD